MNWVREFGRREPAQWLLASGEIQLAIDRRVRVAVLG